MSTNTELLASFPEINPANYTDDDVNALNAWGISAHSAIEALESENSETKRLRDEWKKSAEELLIERDALQAQLAAAQGQEPTGYLLPTTGKFVHAGTVMAGHAGTDWIKPFVAPIPQQPAEAEATGTCERGEEYCASKCGTPNVCCDWYIEPAAPIPQQPRVPEGWKLVPIVPTSEMIAIGQSIFGAFVEDTPADYKRIYAAMLAAAPQPKEKQ